MKKRKMTPVIVQFMKSFEKFSTVDSEGLDKFGNMIQGFVGLIENENTMGEHTSVIPFVFDSEAMLDQVLDRISHIELQNYVGVSFVSHYKHYPKALHLQIHTKE